MDNMGQQMEQGYDYDGDMGMGTPMQENPAEALLFLIEEILDKYMLIKTKSIMTEAEMNEGAGLDDQLIDCLKYKQEAMSEATELLMAMGAFDQMGQEPMMEEEEEYMEEDEDMM